MNKLYNLVFTGPPVPVTAKGAHNTPACVTLATYLGALFAMRLPREGKATRACTLTSFSAANSLTL
eukprot:5351653-Pyramimonas_sp.AAC.1